MRSGSSLLTQLLCSNPQIVGYGETHLKFANRRDKLNLAGHVLKSTGKEHSKNHYYFDKILHDYIADSDFFDEPTKVIILLRDPLPSVSSMVGLKEYGTDFRNCGVEDFVYLYTKRARELASYVNSLHPNNAICTSYESLVCDTTSELRRIDRFLELQQPTPKVYTPNRQSKIHGAGDPSAFLQAGKVIGKKPRTLVKLTPDQQRRVEKSFDDLKNRIDQKGIERSLDTASH